MLRLWLLLLIVGCKPVTSRAPSALNTVTIGTSQEPDSLFEPYKQMLIASEILAAGGAPLTLFDEDWQLVPWAAKEIPTLQNGKLEFYTESGQRKMRTTWEIRDEFFWADGKPLIADDFILSYQITKDPTQDVVDRTRVDKIEKMESLGANKKTLVVTWSEPHAYYHNYRNHEALPAHIVGPIYRQQPERLSRSDFGLKPLLAGPFTISKWSPGEYVTAKANRYSKGFVTPKLREITWRIVPNMATLESNLVAGNIDVMSLELHQALNFQKRYGNQFNFYFVPSLAWEHIDFNLDSPILKDKRVRQALAYGADREGITQLLFEGRQPVSHGTVPEKSPYFNPDVRKYNYDTKRANELLDKAGWLRSDSRSLRRKDGKPLRLTLMTTSGNPTRERIQQLLQASWRQLGVDVEIRNQPAKVFVGETLRGRKFPHMALYSGNADPLAFLETAWRCDCVPRASNSFSGANTTGFCNVKADALLKSISRELNPQKRALIAHQFESLFAQELPAMPLYFRVAVSVTKKGLKNWKPTGMTQPVTWNAHEWDWKLPGEIGE